ncbi:uncharacterized protein CC84DRAFT_1264875 [Paraphaeosphaeria sporulosa]|uniref:C2H2-type domain-containing protein n=1 Tax=Paraphaeosphaeria sporulosa TaxID=1460663 RepID=A0A177BTF2_9PLEO|nr:uncharacterized protein CC84DRAFT_1264875 [Paraphaeosphaeria sporulosa]OAF98673.1 hypothetical protein CC84DRAFT_1264875 [Paraphaeosphaeria sporulosa]
MPKLKTLIAWPSPGRATPVHLSANESDSGDNRVGTRGRRLERSAVDEDEIGENKEDVEMEDCSRKRRRSRKGLDKKFECPHTDCGKQYSRAEHLYRHQLNHKPKQIYHCDFPDCNRCFVREDLCARHRERHTARGSQLLRKDTFSHNLTPIVSEAISGSTSKFSAKSEIFPPFDCSITNSIPAISPPSVFGTSPTPSSAAFSGNASPKNTSIPILDQEPYLQPFVYLPFTEPLNSTDLSPVAGDHNSSDGERTHSLREQRSPSTDVTTVAASSPAGSFGDTLTFVDTKVNTDDRLLNPSKYIDNIEQLRQLVFQNSAIKCQEKASNISSDASDGYVLLRELCSLIFRTCRSLRSLQEAGFCEHFFSVLVLDKSRLNVAKLLPIEIARVEQLWEIFEETLLDAERGKVEKMKASRKEGTPGFNFKSNILQKLSSACRDLLSQLQVMPTVPEPPDPILLLATTVHFLDLAVLSYVGTHIGDAIELYRSQHDDTVHIPGRFGALQKTKWGELHNGDHVTLRKRQLQCLDKFLGYRNVWVFQNHINPSRNERLYLSTDVTTLADVWGPLWKSKADAKSRRISRYDVGNGFVVPWDRNQEFDPLPSSHGEGGTEVFCHWICTREWDDDYVEQHQKEVFSKDFFESDRLLIGASVKDRLAVNDQCAIPMARKLQIKQAMKNAGNLRHRGTCKPRQEKGSQTYQVQASAAGFATLGTTLEYKRVEGFNIKDALLQRWRNGSRNIKYLEIWGGVEVSLCTENARRIQLLHLLRSPGLSRYLKTICFQWNSSECELAYFEALKDRRSFRKFWKEHPEWQRNIGDAINECFIALEDTGVDERDGALSALWVEVFENEDEREADGSASEFAVAEEHLVVLRRSEHTWTGLLKDSPECITMAITESICLDFDDSDGYGMRCQSLRFSQDGRNARRHSPGYSVLQTAILVNEDLLEDSGQLCYRTSSRKRKIVECEEEKAQAEMKNGSRRKQHSEDYARYHMEYFGDASQSWNGYWDIKKWVPSLDGMAASSEHHG